ncbi:heme b synthase [Methanohalophilus portucalensis]|uniref:Heme b synthase n=3 Tax=Methanohalophilus portucalensis TaxID=39664 RepID=A0A1X7NSG9_9EURY|nr:heme b synthase [Methanohalophilus portucalensis]RNI11487.1 heme b synthase [Methanohalophilus portucalensis FDF-1]SMH41083.1 heme b synthase [Methanohalophilus portucalensis FDF-1]
MTMSEEPNPPRLIAWELTSRCNLSCVHCRGASTDEKAIGELDTSEAKTFIDQVASLGSPILILSGGEPLVRPDVYELANYGTNKGLRVVLATNGTLLERETVRKLKEAGIKRVSISLDGADSATHDGFRGVEGAFDKAMEGIDALKAEGMDFQINTTITKRNLGEIPRILKMATSLNAEALHIFLLVPTGRGENLANEEIPPAEYERILRWFYEQKKHTSLELKATCAPHYFRIMRQCAEKEGMEVSINTHGFDAVSRGCLGGTAFCFVSSTGDVQPCGYLPAIAGNIRNQSFGEIWNNSTLFNELRDFSLLKGKCGKCEYKNVCGGCRARAYAATGDYLEEEPYCIYHPRQK